MTARIDNGARDSDWTATRTCDAPRGLGVALWDLVTRRLRCQAEAQCASNVLAAFGEVAL